VIQFKKGAFVSLRGVKPHFMTFKSLTGIRPVHGDSINIFHFFNIFIGHGLTSYTCNEMPIFAPNEFFWKNHWDGKEEKWAVYARVM